MALAESSAPEISTHGIAEVAEQLGLSAHTLRYYEKIGLLDVERDQVGHRIYSTDNLARLRFITYLRATQLPIRDLRRYFRLADEGPHTAAERLALLKAHRDAVQAQLEQARSALEAIDFKIEVYGGQLTSCDANR